MNYQDFYNESIDQPAAFWKKQAQKLDWFSFPEEVLYKDEHDLYRWFKGGTMNTCYLALIKNGNTGSR